MANYSTSQVIVFHDETEDKLGSNFKGHVLFFVPTTLLSVTSTPLFGLDSVAYSPFDQLSSAILDLRNKTNYGGKLHFSNISGKKWDRRADAHYAAVELAVDSLRSKGQRSFKYPLRCKLALMFYPAEADFPLYGGSTRKERVFRHDETILRMLMKGAAHYLYDDDNHVEIVNIVADGQPQHRKMSDERVIRQLTYENQSGRVPVREYVSFAAGAGILHLPSHHREHAEGSDAYRQAHLLQLSDLLLGATLRSCFTGLTKVGRVPRQGDSCVKKDVLAQPVKNLLDKRGRGGGFLNSGHYKSFTISLVEFANNTVNFREVETRQFQMKDSDPLQMQFPT